MDVSNKLYLLLVVIFVVFISYGFFNKLKESYIGIKQTNFNSREGFIKQQYKNRRNILLQNGGVIKEHFDETISYPKIGNTPVKNGDYCRGFYPTSNCNNHTREKLACLSVYSSDDNRFCQYNESNFKCEKMDAVCRKNDEEEIYREPIQEDFANNTQWIDSDYKPAPGQQCIPGAGTRRINIRYHHLGLSRNQIMGTGNIDLAKRVHRWAFDKYDAHQINCIFVNSAGPFFTRGGTIYIGGSSKATRGYTGHGNAIGHGCYINSKFGSSPPQPPLVQLPPLPPSKNCDWRGHLASWGYAYASKTFDYPIKTIHMGSRASRTLPQGPTTLSIDSGVTQTRTHGFSGKKMWVDNGLRADWTVYFQNCYIPGCEDPKADNYDPYANTDSGGCIYTILGCTDSTADNYDPSANKDNEGCLYFGCINPAASNYSAKANVDDGSCSDLPLVGGCNDSAALNYNEKADVNDGTCNYMPPPAPEPEYYSVGNCGIQYDKGYCNASSSINIEKIDSNDIGLDNPERNMDCFNKAKIKYGASLTGVEIRSNQPNSGCYAHLSTVTQGDKSSDALCHVIGEHQMTCPINFTPEECDAMVSRKNTLNTKQEELIERVRNDSTKIASQEEILRNTLSNKLGSNALSKFKTDESIFKSADNIKLKSRIEKIRKAYVEDSFDSLSKYCKTDVVGKIVNANSRALQLAIDYETLRFNYESNKAAIIRYNLLNLKSEKELQEREQAIQLSEKTIEQQRERDRLKAELQEKLQQQADAALAVKLQQLMEFANMQKQKLLEIEKQNEINAEKLLTKLRKEEELVEAKALALKEAEKIAETKKQRDAIRAAKERLEEEVAEIKQKIEDTLEKNEIERTNLYSIIADLEIKIKNYDIELKDLENKLTDTELKVRDGSLFNRQLQRGQPRHY